LSPYVARQSAARQSHNHIKGNLSRTSGADERTGRRAASALLRSAREFQAGTREIATDSKAKLVLLRL